MEGSYKDIGLEEAGLVQAAVSSIDSLGVGSRTGAEGGIQVVAGIHR